MRAGPDDLIEFECPHCAESLAISASMREALLDRGCVICGSPVTAESFT